MSQIGTLITNLPTPCLVVNLKAVETNCLRMLEKASNMGVQLRGQTKTHKTVEAGILQTGGTKRFCNRYFLLFQNDFYLGALLFLL